MDFVAQANNLNNPCNPCNLSTPDPLNDNGVDRVYTLPGLSHCTPVKAGLALEVNKEDSHSHLKASVGAALKVLQVLVDPRAHLQVREDSDHPRAHLQVKEVKVLEVKEVNNLYLQAHPVMETVQALEAKDSEVNPNILLLHRGLQLRGQDLQHRDLRRDLHLGLLHRGLQFSLLNQPLVLEKIIVTVA